MSSRAVRLLRNTQAGRAALRGTANARRSHRCLGRSNVTTGGEPLFLQWTRYQRRSTVLAARLGARHLALAHRFGSRWLRPLDYAAKALRSYGEIARQRPTFIVVQSPPYVAAVPALWAGATVVIDAHNAAFEGRWSRAPGAARVFSSATACLAHNDAIAEIARARFPRARWITVYDPVDDLTQPSAIRDPRTVLYSGSFRSDEPLAVLIGAVQRLPDIRFVMTADPETIPPVVRRELTSLPNVVFTGFLPESQYHHLLSTCGASLVLSTRTAVQPSGACEALAADTPLVVSHTPLARSLFGTWAHTVPNDPDAVAEALGQACGQRLDLSAERRRWNARVDRGVLELRSVLQERLGALEVAQRG